MDVVIALPHCRLLLLVSFIFTIQISIHGAFQIPKFKVSPSSSRSLLSKSIASTPPMGWNSWNHFQCNIDEKIIKETADALISTGLSAVGFTYVNIDDCWGEWNRDENGNIVARRSTFSSGIKAIADYVHERGLKLGIYSDAGIRTCSNTMPGSLGHEDQDALTFSQWGVDYLKYDNCYSNGLQPRTRFETMSKALAKVGRPIFYAICEWGQDDPAKWAGSLGNAWRTTGDINDSWASFTYIADANNEVAQYAGPGGWNDPDMLEVGNGGMTLNEYHSHFSIWCLMKAPLLIGCDIRNVSSEILAILLNKEVIAVNQDLLGVQGQKLRSTNGLEVWAGKLSKGRVAVVLWNRSLLRAQISVGWNDLGVTTQTPVNVRDLWEHSWVKVGGSSLASYVDPHSCKMYIISPTRVDL